MTIEVNGERLKMAIGVGAVSAFAAFVAALIVGDAPPFWFVAANWGAVGCWIGYGAASR